MVFSSLSGREVCVLCVAVLTCEEHRVRLRNERQDAEVLRLVRHHRKLLVLRVIGTQALLSNHGISCYDCDGLSKLYSKDGEHLASDEKHDRV